MSADKYLTVPLGKLVEISSGKRNSSDAVSDGLYPFYTCGKDVLKIDVFEHDREAVLLGGNNANAIFPVFYANGKFTARQRVYVIWSANTEVLDNRFFYFALSHLTHSFTAKARGTTTLFVTLPMLKDLEIPLPAISTQRHVSDVLAAFENRIALLRETNTTLEAIAQTLFKSWFIDFDPVRAKMEGRAPEGMDESTAALFPNDFEESALGLMPRGWRVTALDSIATVTMGLSPKGDSYNSEGIGVPLINGPVEFGEYFPVKTKWTQEVTRSTKEGDLIFCVRGSTTGRRVISDGDYCIGRGVCAIRANNGFNTFMYQTIDFGLNRMLEKTTGSVFPSLSAPDIKSFKVLVPTDDLLEKYEQTVSTLTQCVQENHRRIATLSGLRDTLLPRLISGELRLPDIARFAEAISGT